MPGGVARRVVSLVVGFLRNVLASVARPVCGATRLRAGPTRMHILGLHTGYHALDLLSLVSLSLLLVSLSLMRLSFHLPLPLVGGQSLIRLCGTRQKQLVLRRVKNDAPIPWPPLNSPGLAPIIRAAQQPPPFHSATHVSFCDPPPPLGPSTEGVAAVVGTVGLRRQRQT